MFHEEWGRTSLTWSASSAIFDLSEEAAQDAFATAAQRWPGDGLPAIRHCQVTPAFGSKYPALRKLGTPIRLDRPHRHRR